MTQAKEDIDQSGVTKKKAARPLSRLLNSLGILELPPLVGLVGLVATFQVLSGNFLSGRQVEALASLTAAVAIPAVGLTLLIISGEFDLSVGAVFAFAPIVLGTLVADYGWSVWSALPVVLLACATLGLINGSLTTGLRIPSFIVTLGALFGIRGLSIIVTGGFNVLYFGPDPILSLVGGSVGRVPAPLLWSIGLTAVMWFVLERTPYGNWTKAAGSPLRSAVALGVPVRRVKVTNFVVSAVLAGFGGIAQFAHFRSVSVGSGDNLELTAIVAVVIGGTALFGVKGTAIGTLIGAVILGVLKTGLIIVGAPGAWFTSLIGALLIVAVAVNSGIGRAQSRFR